MERREYQLTVRGNGIGWVPDGGAQAQAREPQQPQGGEEAGSQQNAGDGDGDGTGEDAGGWVGSGLRAGR
jgi:hypothetical protein